jgi:hypothetical protein
MCGNHIQANAHANFTATFFIVRVSELPFLVSTYPRLSSFRRIYRSVGDVALPDIVAIA